VLLVGAVAAEECVELGDGQVVLRELPGVVRDRTLRFGLSVGPAEDLFDRHRPNLIRRVS
jgi:hypothetical protein